MSEPQEVVIARLGSQGDGIAETPAGEVFVPGALPGERWRLGSDDAPPARLSEAPDRAEPQCRHFGTCGGCTMQHLTPDSYRAWKRGIILQAFAHRGIEADVRPVVSMPHASRRRAVLGIANRGDRIEIGFREAGQHKLVDIVECPVLEPRITTALEGLRRLSALVMKPGTGGRLAVTATETGLDVALATGSMKPTVEQRARVAAEASALGIARLAIEGEVIVMRSKPQLTISGVTLEPPNGVFLQAVAAAETMLAEHAVAGIGKAKLVADLFCGVGTFTLPLARRAEVLAIDDDNAALATLSAAIRGAQGLKPITVKRRDLFREPLSAQELKDVDAVVIDPPRAGAKDQMEAIARSKLRTVVAVSCNPATLARDVRILIDAGFKLGPVTPIDQFVFSPHVEAVSVLKR